MEKTIALLKKVVEKKQAEVDRLKLAPGVVSNEQLYDLENENRHLRDQLEELRLVLAAMISLQGPNSIQSFQENLHQQLIHAYRESVHHMPNATCQTLHAKRHMPNATCQTLHATYRMPHIECHI